MKQKVIFGIWIFFYCLCAILGHITEPTTAQAVAMTILSCVFFVPGFLLLIQGKKQQNLRLLKAIRIISFTSLAATFLMMLLNILSVFAPEGLGNVLHEILILVSVPMFACRPRALSLFLWAILAFSTPRSKQDQK